MIIVQNSIVSDDIADQRFGCDLACCKGACCVDGDSGAPLMEDEVAKIEAVLEEALPKMTEEGRKAVEEQGVAVRDKDGDLGTTLIDGGACAFVTPGPTVAPFAPCRDCTSRCRAISIPSGWRTSASLRRSTTTSGTSVARPRARASRCTSI